MSRVRMWLAGIGSALKARISPKSVNHETLLARAGVPRSLPPALLGVARLADLRLEETEDEKKKREKKEADDEAAAEKKKEEEEADPPWGSDEEFDPKRAWKLITDLRDDLKKVKTTNTELEAKVKKHDDASKSEQEKLEERAGTAESTATEATREAARLKVALKKGLSETQAKRLVGDDEEALEKDADELLESFGGTGEGEENDPPPKTPRERQRTGAAPSSQAEETDPDKLAEEVPRGY